MYLQCMQLVVNGFLCMVSLGFKILCKWIKLPIHVNILTLERMLLEKVSTYINLARAMSLIRLHKLNASF